MKKTILYILCVLLMFSPVEFSLAADTEISINGGESCEFTNKSARTAVLQILADDNITADYVVYDKDGEGIQTGLSINYTTDVEVPSGGRLMVTGGQNLKALCIQGSDTGLEFNRITKPALNKVTLKAGESYEFKNIGQKSNTIEVCPDSLGYADYDYAVYTKEGTNAESVVSCDFSTSISVPEGGRAVITANRLSRAFEVGGAGGLFTGSISANPALYKVGVNPGEVCEVINKGMSEHSISASIRDLQVTSYDFAIYDKDGKEYLSLKSAKSRGGLVIPAGGRITLKVNSFSNSIDFGGDFNLYNRLEIRTYPDEEGFAFPYHKLNNASSDQDILQVLTQSFNKLSESQKADDDIRNEAVNFAEYAIERIATREISPNGSGTIQVGYELIRPEIGQAETAKADIEKILMKNGLDTNREMEASINLVIKGGGENLSVAINKDTAAGTSNITYLKINSGDVITTFVTDNLIQEMGDSKDMSIHITKETRADVSQSTSIESTVGSGAELAEQPESKATSIQAYRIGLKKGGKPLAKLDKNMKLAFPVPEGDPDYSCVFVLEGEGSQEESVGGKYARVTGKIEIETNTSGRYYVKENKKSFGDIASKDARMRKAIEVMAAKGVISGRSKNKFDPDGSISRVEFVKLIIRTLYYLDNNAQAGFKDVPKSSWYYTYVASSKKEGLINGYPDNTFRGKNTITKQEIVKVCAASLHGKKKYKYPETAEKYLAFKDSNTIPDWVNKYLALAVREKLLTKRADGRFDGERPMTRGETALILYRLYEKM